MHVFNHNFPILVASWEIAISNWQSADELTEGTTPSLRATPSRIEGESSQRKLGAYLLCEHSPSLYEGVARSDGVVPSVCLIYHYQFSSKI